MSARGDLRSGDHAAHFDVAASTGTVALVLDDASWKAVAEFVVGPSGPEICSVTVRAVGARDLLDLDAEPVLASTKLTARVLRSVPIGELSRLAAVAYGSADADRPSGVDTGRARMVADRLARDLASTTRAPVSEEEVRRQALGLLDGIPDPFERTGRRGTAHINYARWAACFVALSRVSDRPAQEMAEYLGVPATRVHDALRRARQRDLYVTAGPGRAGGELTEYGRQSLAEAEDVEWQP